MKAGVLCTGASSPSRDQLSQSPTFGEIQDQNQGVAGGHDFVQSHEVPMIERGEYRGLDVHIAQRRCAAQGDALEGDGLAGRHDSGPPHVSRAAEAQQAFDHVTGQFPAAHGCRP